MATVDVKGLTKSASTDGVSMTKAPWHHPWHRGGVMTGCCQSTW